jgi:LPXTG-site transpeptidase (sortase) family protein
MASITTLKNKPRRIVLGILALLTLVVIMNYGYWIQQAQYYLGLTEESHVLSSVRLGSNTIFIPSLMIEAPIIYPNSTKESDFQKALKDGVVHYPGTAKIGETGNPYIFGHSSNYFWVKSDYNSIFALLPKIKPGDSIFASDEKGKIYEYITQETHVIGPKDVQWIDKDENKEKLLTVQTSYPIGTALKRFIVIAKIK